MVRMLYCSGKRDHLNGTIITIAFMITSEVANNWN